MSKFNLAAVRARVTSPVVSARSASARTYEGAPGYLRDPKSELFLLAVANMAGEDTFYERAADRDDRFAALVHQVAVTDVEWLARLIAWLRGPEGNLRSAPVVAACEAVAARLTAGLEGGNRALVDAACQRADEPGEVLAYWTSRYGRAIPKPVKRGVADACARLYDERALLKWDAAGKGFRFGDVLELVHAAPAPGKPWQGDLYAHAIDRRHQRDKPIPESLRTLRARAELMAVPVEARRAALDPARLRAAGMTWEALAGWLQGPMDAAAWQAVIPSMGYMALLRNLRNFDEAGVPDEVAAGVAARIADPAQVLTSRQLPFRFYSAYRAAPSLRWGGALEQALQASIGNIPAPAGRTLILVDTSGSMACRFSKDGTVMRWDAAALFGIALAQRCAEAGGGADLVSFSDTTKVFDVRRGGSVLRQLERWKSGGWFLNCGTETAKALRKHYAGHDRVVVLTDEQAFFDPRGTVDAAVPERVPTYTWNLAGYRFGQAPSGGAYRHTFGGLTDAAFRMLPLLESGASADWPF